MFFACVAFVLGYLSNLFAKWRGLLKDKCSHPSLRYVGDAWDYEYICPYCDKNWFNQIPPLIRPVYCNGKKYQLDGSGTGNGLRELVS